MDDIVEVSEIIEEYNFQKYLGFTDNIAIVRTAEQSFLHANCMTQEDIDVQRSEAYNDGVNSVLTNLRILLEKRYIGQLSFKDIEDIIDKLQT